MRLDLAYDGRAFAGWAAQPGLRTVEGELSAALGRVLRREPPRLVVAGRTDAGVSARGQVVHVDVPVAAWEALPGRAAGRPDAPTPGRALLRRLAGVLPDDVVVRGARPAPEGFDARFGALSRRYAYRVVDDPAVRDPLRRGEVLVVRAALDVAAMDRALAPLVGEHDWLPFCRPREGASTVRTVLRLGWRRDAGGVAVADVEADAFCHHMVRSLVGASLAVGEGRRDEGWPARVLAAGVRDPAVAVAPATGLVLEEVRYPADEELAAQARRARTWRGGGAGAGPSSAGRGRRAGGRVGGMSTTPDESSAVGDDVYQPEVGDGLGDTDITPEYDADNSLDKSRDAILDEGYSPPEKPRELGRFGETAEEQRQGESLDQRLAEEVPDPAMAVPDPLAEDPGPVRHDGEMSTGDADDTLEPLPGTEADLDTDGELLDDQVGDARAGRLVAPSGGIGPDTEKDEVASDVGIDGGAAGAEEAAVHVVDEDRL